jgi:hypothetical protein
MPTYYCSVQNILSSSLPSIHIRIKIQSTVILSAVIYWCKTLKQEHRLKVSESRVLMKACGLGRNEVTGKWRILDELHDQYSSPNIIRVIIRKRMRWAGHVARMGRGEVCTGFW